MFIETRIPWIAHKAAKEESQRTGLLHYAVKTIQHTPYFNSDGTECIREGYVLVLQVPVEKIR